jgi:serpin B
VRPLTTTPQLIRRRRAGREAAGEEFSFLLPPLSLHPRGARARAAGRRHERPDAGARPGVALSVLQRAAATNLVIMTALRDLPRTSFACVVWVDRQQALRPEVAGAIYAAVAESVDFVSQMRIQ